MKIGLFVTLLFAFFCLNAQEYVPIDTADVVVRTKYIKNLKNKQENFAAYLKENYAGKLGREMKLGYENFAEGFNEEIEEGQFTFDKNVNAYFQSILNEIITKNPQIDTDLDLLISKDPSLNAYCMVDGLMVAHMGLLYWMENEDQIAAIISHEISHKLLNHSLKSQENYISASLDKDNKKLVRDLKKQDHNRQLSAFELFKSQLYETTEQQRKYEMEADSLGYLLLKNTKYNSQEFPAALDLMVRYDTIQPDGLEKKTYAKYFDLPNQPFDSTWLNQEDFSIYDYSHKEEKFEEDAIRTHPKAEQRIEKLRAIFSELKGQNPKRTEATNAYKEWQKIAEMEQPSAYFAMEDYGKGLYITLYRLQQNKNEEYYKKWLGHFLDKIHQSRKDYTLNRYVDRIEPEDQTESYQLFLNFIWNLSAKEIENFRNFYAQ